MDGHGQITEQTVVERGLHHQTETGPVRDRLTVQRRNLFGKGETRLSAPHPESAPGWLAATLCAREQAEQISKPLPQFGKRFAHGRGSHIELLGRSCNTALSHQVFEHHQEVQIEFTQGSHIVSCHWIALGDPCMVNNTPYSHATTYIRCSPTAKEGPPVLSRLRISIAIQTDPFCILTKKIGNRKYPKQ